MFGKLKLGKQDKAGIKEVFKTRGLELSKSRFPDPKTMPTEEQMMSELRGKNREGLQFQMLWKGMGMSDEDYREVVMYIRSERLKEVG